MQRQTALTLRRITSANRAFEETGNLNTSMMRLKGMQRYVTAKYNKDEAFTEE